MKELLHQINQKIAHKPLIYFCREAERAIGLEHHLKNYHICCIEKSDMVAALRERGVSVFCLEEEGTGLINRSSGKLLSQDITKDWINSIAGENGFYALTFIPTNTLDYKLTELGGTLLGNPYELYLTFENKISQAEHLAKYNVSVPKTIIEYIHELEYDQCVEILGEKFVLQTERAHTGSGTFINPDHSQCGDLKERFAGNKIKLTEFIEGTPLTINACIYNEQLYIGTLQYQITGISELTSGTGATVGNDFSYLYEQGLEDSVIVNVVQEVSKIGKMLKEHNYKGLFGLDLVMDSDANIYVIEINARQTANIPFQTALELDQTKQPPLLLLHLAELLGVQETLHYEHMQMLKGAQVFLRAKEDTTVTVDKESGVYTRDADSVRKGYTISDLERDEEFLLHIQDHGTKRSEYDEIARLQTRGSVMGKDGEVKEWVLEEMRRLEFRF